MHTPSEVHIFGCGQVSSSGRLAGTLEQVPGVRAHVLQTPPQATLQQYPSKAFREMHSVLTLLKYPFGRRHPPAPLQYPPEVQLVSVRPSDVLEHRPAAPTLAHV